MPPSTGDIGPVAQVLVMHTKAFSQSAVLAQDSPNLLKRASVIDGCDVIGGLQPMVAAKPKHITA
jgi:hypothetical protein